MRRVTKVDPSGGHVCNEWSDRTGKQCGKPATVQIEFDGPLGPPVRQLCWSHAEGFGLIDSQGRLLLDA